ncbi:xylulokinase [Segnochrobactrum spirostomi]|uniref:Xylulokinase n=1 Tax=Segnochrobactrum spirostomi TaxID=2608987 RepID=A0A6A7Y9D0_9HYPH|nr:FGGY family carbohydrate kinase [Segnochrobactrum spirostomi]MQT15486.1 hypothetical protein [Segnochrobactrum spirostomi]
MAPSDLPVRPEFPAGSDLYLGLDLGTSSLKAVLCDGAMAVVGSGSAGYPMASPVPGAAEQNPADWVDAAGRAVRAALADAEAAGCANAAAAVRAIGLSGQLPTLVCLKDGIADGPAIVWSDARADSAAAARLGPDGPAMFYRRTGMPVDGRYLAPMLAFHRADAAALDGILSAKDYLCFALTGRSVTDPSTAAGYAVFDLATGRFADDLAAVFDLDTALLPAIAPAGAVAGTLTPAAAARLGLPAGVPVMVGAADSAAGALAMTGGDSAAVAIVMGSSTIIFAACDSPRPDDARRYLLTPHAAAPGEAARYGREMDLLATGTGLAWLSRLTGSSVEALETAALAAPPGARGVRFAPYLAGGEQGALWDPSLAGVIHGLTIAHGTGDLARAYFEGIFFEMRRCLDVLEEATPVRRAVVSGAAAGNPGLIHLMADVLGRPVQVFTHAAPSALGAAMLAAGRTDPAGAYFGPVTQPGPAAELYDEFYGAHRALFPRLAVR